MDLKEENILGSDILTHWYYVSKGRALHRLLGNIYVEEILDVGAGSGVFSRQLLDYGTCQRAICVDSGYLDERIEIYHDREILFTRAVKNVSQKLILMMDVLEHVDDDIGLLREYTDRMPKNGYIVITVPAFQYLWSSHDIFLEHRRRYTRDMLEAIVKAANLQIISSRYFFGMLFPIVISQRWFDRYRFRSGTIEAKSALKKYSKPLNTALILFHDMERITLFPFNTFAGLSVFCLARHR